MKKLITLLPVIVVLFAVNNSCAQGIINTLGSGGTFSVKGNSSTCRIFWGGTYKL